MIYYGKVLYYTLSYERSLPCAEQVISYDILWLSIVLYSEL